MSPISTSGKPATTNRSPADSSSHLVAADPFEGHQLGQAALHRRLALGELLLEQCHGLATAHHAVDDTTDGQATQVLAGVEGGDHRLQRRVGVALRLRNGLEDQVEQRRQIGIVCRHADTAHGATLAGHGRHDLEVDVVIAGIEVDEQLVDLVEHLFRACVAAVDLVDDDDRRQVECQRLLQHVAGLRQRTFGGIDEQQHAVDHGECTLDLTTEVGVAGRVDQVDLHVLPGDRGGLGQDGDAALALLVVGVHDPVDDRLVGSEGAGGAQQRVHEGGLAMVDVRDERDIAKGGVHDAWGVWAWAPGSSRTTAAR